MKEIGGRQEQDRKAFDVYRKREYKVNKERWKRELSMDEATPKRQRDATLQWVIVDLIILVNRQSGEVDEFVYLEHHRRANGWTKYVCWMI